MSQLIKLENIERSLLLDEGYSINNYKIDDEQKTIEVEVIYNEKNAICPSCAKHVKIHDRLKKSWRHTNLDEWQVYVTFKTPRVKCNEHGVKLSSVAWAKPKHRFTIALEDLVCKQAENMSFVQIAKELGEHDTRIRRVVKRRENEENN